jgi:hypothetical protein
VAQIQQPLITQILESLLEGLATQEMFSGQVISDLKQLAQAGDLSKPDKVIEAIKAASEDEYEVA